MFDTLKRQLWRVFLQARMTRKFWLIRRTLRHNSTSGQFRPRWLKVGLTSDITGAQRSGASGLMDGFGGMTARKERKWMFAHTAENRRASAWDAAARTTGKRCQIARNVVRTTWGAWTATPTNAATANTTGRRTNFLRQWCLALPVRTPLSNDAERWRNRRGACGASGGRRS